MRERKSFWERERPKPQHSHPRAKNSLKHQQTTIEQVAGVMNDGATIFPPPRPSFWLNTEWFQ
jgi:hypothetical protein